VVLQASAEERALPTAAARPLLKPRWRVTTAQAWPVPQTSAVLVPGHFLQLVPVMSPRTVVMRAAATPAVRQMTAPVRSLPSVVRFSSTPPPEQQRE
jgi:hypothetical protein